MRLERTYVLEGQVTISIHAPLAGCDARFGLFIHRTTISIHAPLAGCDDIQGILTDGVNISIHAPLAGCDNENKAAIDGLRDFNPRTPCGVRLEGGTVEVAKATISIHAPLAGCDLFKLHGIRA